MSGWPSETRAAYAAAPVTAQRRALAHYWRLRAAEHQEWIPAPSKDEPLSVLLDMAERHYRRYGGGHCRGSVRDV